MVSEVDGSVLESDGFKSPNLGVFWVGLGLGVMAICHLFFLLVTRLGRAAHSSICSDSTSRASLATCQSYRGGGVVEVDGDVEVEEERVLEKGFAALSLRRPLPVLVGVDSLGRMAKAIHDFFASWGKS